MNFRVKTKSSYLESARTDPIPVERERDQRNREGRTKNGVNPTSTRFLIKSRPRFSSPWNFGFQIRYQGRDVRVTKRVASIGFDGYLLAMIALHLARYEACDSLRVTFWLELMEYGPSRFFTTNMVLKERRNQRPR